MAKKAPGKAHRKGLTLIQLMAMFPTEGAATKWFEEVLWNNDRCCGKCGSVRTTQAIHKYMPYWCSDCRSYFSIRTGTLWLTPRFPSASGHLHLPLPDQSQERCQHEAQPGYRGVAAYRLGSCFTGFVRRGLAVTVTVTTPGRSKWTKPISAGDGETCRTPSGRFFKDAGRLARRLS